MGKTVKSFFALNDAEKAILRKQSEDALFFETLPEQFRKLQADFAALKREFAALQAAHELLSSDYEALKMQPQGTERKQQTIRSDPHGTTIRFGKFDWYVIKKTDTTLTLLCKDIIGQMQFYSDSSGYAWASSSLRRWLNSSFYQSFTAQEKAKIVIGVQDCVTLLNTEEAKAIDQKILACGSWWWLRSLGVNVGNIAGVCSSGSLDETGKLINNEGGVRPVIKINRD